MPEKHLFEYAVLRVVPCVEREEFINVGVILYCASKGFLQTVFEVNESRLRAIAPEIDLEELHDRLHAFQRICAGRKDGGTIGQLAVASRFRWLASTRSTVVQSSPIHPGLCNDPQETLDRLLDQLVK